MPGASSAADAQPGSIVFLIDPTPYRVLRCNPTSDSLMVFPAMGSKKSGFFAPKSTVWTPPKNLQSLAINTEPMDCELPPSSPSPFPPIVLPDIADCGTMTTPIHTSSVSCYNDSFENLEFAALLKENEAVETLEQILADTRKELGAQKALVDRLEVAFDKQKQNYEDTLRSLEEKTRQKRLDDRNLADLKDTISDLRTQVANLHADRQALPLLHQLLYQLTAPDIVYMDKVTPTNFLYTVLAADRHTSTAEIKKHYHQLMRLCHPDRNPGVDRNISQQLVAIHNILVDPTTRKIYDCCGIRAVTRKDTTHFCRLCNPRPLYESFDDLWQ